jgi:heat shock protein HslJ
MLRLTLLLFLSLNLCNRADETLSGYGAADTVWILQSIDGKRFSPRATITFTEEGKIAGEAPCNRFFGAQLAPYPWFEAAQIASTKRSCPDHKAETQFLRALSEMTISEVSATTLILSNDAKRVMVFTSQ